MLSKRDIFEIHRLFNEGYSIRKIALKLGFSRYSIKQYLKNPEKKLYSRKASVSKLDSYKEQIKEYLAEDETVSAVVIYNRIKEKGYSGEISLLRGYLRKTRGSINKKQAFIRFESAPGEQVQIDWGYFGYLQYGSIIRKLYALAVIEGYSRMLYVEFSHSQKQEVLHQILLNAFKFFNGTPKEILSDNMLTAVIERRGKIIRFNENYLEFLRPFRIVPAACNIRSPHEKGKIEKSIDYIKRNFMPLRKFDNLSQAQAEVRQWLEKTANQRIHQTTGQKPIERFAEVSLTPLPAVLPEVYETFLALVHKDFAVRFDNNSYTVLPWLIGKKLMVKADQAKVQIYHDQKLVAVHKRSWKKRERIENPSHREHIKKLRSQIWTDQDAAYFISMGEIFREYLEILAKANLPLKKNISALLSLKDQYGRQSLEIAIKKALEHKAMGSDYIENILYQKMTPKFKYQPIKLKDESLNRLRLTEPLLAEYDIITLKRRKKNERKRD